jgi:prevent-host-death family protein
MSSRMVRSCQLDKKAILQHNIIMKIMPVGEMKTHFSEVIEAVKKGEQIIISYGKKRKNIAVIVPYSQYEKTNGIRLGLLKDKAKCGFAEDFKITTEELVEM